MPPRHLYDRGNIHLSHRVQGTTWLCITGQVLGTEPGRGACCERGGCVSAVFRHKISVDRDTKTEIHPRSVSCVTKTSKIWHQCWAWGQQRPKGSKDTVNRGRESSEETVIGGLRKGAPCCVWHTWWPLTYSEVRGTTCTKCPPGLMEEAFRKMLEMPHGVSVAAHNEALRRRSMEGTVQTRAETTESVPTWRCRK